MRTANHFYITRFVSAISPCRMRHQTEFNQCSVCSLNTCICTYVYNYLHFGGHLTHGAWRMNIVLQWQLKHTIDLKNFSICFVTYLNINITTNFKFFMNRKINSELKKNNPKNKRYNLINGEMRKSSTFYFFSNHENFTP